MSVTTQVTVEKNFYEDLEKNLLCRLEELTLEDKEVVIFPEKKGGIQPVAIKPRLMIIFNGEKGKDERATDQVHQEVDVMVDVWIFCKNRTGENGLYDAIAKCDLYLLGWTPPNCVKKLVFQDGSYQDMSDDNWIYVVGYKTARMKVQYDNSETGPLLKQTTFTEHVPTEFVIPEG